MSQIKIAQAIATIAHRGQTDKAGQPYIDQPRRVAADLRGEPSELDGVDRGQEAP